MSNTYIWKPPAWYIDPARADRLGVLCGSTLYTWPSRDPRAQGGFMGEPQVVDLSYLSARDPYQQVGDLIESQWQQKLRAIWLIPTQGTQPSATDMACIRHWETLAIDALQASLPERPLHSLSARGPAGNSAILGGIVTREGATSGKPSGAYRCLYAVWPQDAWAIRDLLTDLPEDAVTRASMIASALALVEWLLGVQLWFSPGHSGTTLLRETLPQWGQLGVSLDPLSEEWREVIARTRPSDVRWARPIACAGPQVISIYDRNMSYVSSATDVPCGEPVITASFQRDTTKKRRPLPGAYLISARAPDTWDTRTPGIFRKGRGSGTYPLHMHDVWAWSPYIDVAQAHGWEITIHKGYYWPQAQRHKVFGVWHDRIWEARTEAERIRDQGGETQLIGRMAVRLIKRIGVATIGRLMMHKGHAVMSQEEAEERHLPVLWDIQNDRGELTGMVEVETEIGRQDLHHPEWWSWIIAHAGARLLSLAVRLAPTTAAGLYIDALYSTAPVPEIDHGAQARGYFRHKGDVLIPDAVLAEGNFVRLVQTAAHANPINDPQDAGWVHEEGDEAQYG